MLFYALGSCEIWPRISQIMHVYLSLVSHLDHVGSLRWPSREQPVQTSKKLEHLN
uniref:Uncharacterized protein n=1 Tax=Arundo donax TaxID=35708 RepID=A0A0A8YQF2_ARUDO